VDELLRELGMVQKKVGPLDLLGIIDQKVNVRAGVGENRFMDGMDISRFDPLENGAAFVVAAD
jgi:hypothetical protein